MNRREMLRSLALASAGLAVGSRAGATSLLDSLVSPASGRAAPILGLGSHGLEEGDLRDLRRVGVSHVRFTLYWHHWENDAAYRAHNRRRIDAAVDEGFKLLVVVHGDDPSWGGWPKRYALYDRYAAFVGRRAREMPGVEGWDLFNEGEGHMTSLFGAERPNRDLVRDGADCALLHRKAYQAIKAANPRARVVAMSMTPDDHGFKRGFFEGGPRYDVFNVHLYGWPMGETLRRDGARVRQMLARYGRAGDEVWCTEFGVSREMLPLRLKISQKVWEEAQATGWKEFVAVNDREQFFSRIYGYQLRTDEAGRHGTAETHGLVRPDGSLRPAGAWLRARMQ